MRYFLGLDSSTTATKALLIDENGQVFDVASSEYSYQTPQPLWSEQDPQLWWHAAAACVQMLLQQSNVSADQIKGIGLTGQMHGLVLIGEGGKVLRPAILWNDQRTGAECDEIKNVIGKKKFIRITGNDALAGFTAPKILWVKNNEPEVYNRIQHILLPKDYIRFKLTNQFALDRAGGSGTVLFNLKKRDWSEEIVGALNIKNQWLPQTFEGTQVTGSITASAAAETGLVEGTPVLAGGGDQAAGAVGVGAVRTGIVSLVLGTSGVVFATTDAAFIEPDGRLHAFCHAAPGKWHLMGVMLSAAGSLRWFRDSLAPGLSFGELVNTANSVNSGSDGLLFLPYLTGERTPHPDPLARGAFVGLTVRHTRSHMTRAIMEGVAFGLRDSFELMKSAGLTKISQARVSGGGSKSTLWKQILADVLNVELVTVNTTEGAAFGAALLAAVGAGVYPDVDTACNRTIEITAHTEPGASQRIYETLYPIYQDLYPALRPSFNALSSKG